jgi:hypothetical protein
VARDVLVRGLPKVVAQDAGAPAGSAVVVDITGAVEFMRTVRVDADGRGSVDGTPSLGPVVTIAMDWDVYFRLACGRIPLASVADEIKAEGDQELAAAILRSFAVTL